MTERRGELSRDQGLAPTTAATGDTASPIIATASSCDAAKFLVALPTWP